MSETQIFPAPSIDEFLPPMSDFHRNQAFFRENLPRLLDSYRGRYVGVHEGRIVAVGDSLVDTAMSAYAKCGYVPVYVDLVTAERTLPERITSPRHEVC